MGTKVKPLHATTRAEDSKVSSRRKWVYLAQLAAVGVAGALLVAGGAWVPGPWLDEGATILSASRSWPSLAEMLGNIDAVHGLYYGIMHLWFDLVALYHCHRRDRSPSGPDW